MDATPRPAAAQAGGELATQLAPALDVDRPVERLVAHAHLLVRRMRQAEVVLDLRRRPAQLEQPHDLAAQARLRASLVGLGRNGESAVATLVERKARYLMLAALPGGRTSPRGPCGARRRDHAAARLRPRSAAHRGQGGWRRPLPGSRVDTAIDDLLRDPSRRRVAASQSTGDLLASTSRAAATSTRSPRRARRCRHRAERESTRHSTGRHQRGACAEACCIDRLNPPHELPATSSGDRSQATPVRVGAALSH